MTKLSPKAILEIRKLKNEADAILAKPHTTASERKRVDVCLAEISAIKEAGVTDAEAYRDIMTEMAGELGLPAPDFTPEKRSAAAAEMRSFEAYLGGASEQRANDLLAGVVTSLTYIEGPEGGVLVPMQFAEQVFEARAQFDPLTDPEAVTVVQEKEFFLRPFQIPGWDLSTIAATKVAESAQHSPDNVPAVTQNLLNRYTYRLGLGASFEFEQDQKAFDSAMAAMARA